MVDEKTPLLKDSTAAQHGSESRRTKQAWPKRISNTIVGTVRIFISTVTAPGYYLVACFYDDNGNFSMTMPFVRIGRQLSRKQRRKKRQAMAASPVSSTRRTDDFHGHTSGSASPTEKVQYSTGRTQEPQQQRSSSVSSASSVDSDTGDESRSKRSIRIKAVNEDALRKRRQRRTDNGASTQSSQLSQQPQLTAENIKSPTSPPSAARLTRYPRAPAPPRPLVPRRQPSYTLPNSTATPANKKTLIIDLDETLIHSMAKGGRMSTGHMVEVKLQSPVGVGGAVLGPQVPILYYVHKRPHCDEFLKKVRDQT